MLFLVTTYSFEYGTFQVERNGKPVGGPTDLCARNPFLRNRGKNEASKGYFLGIDALFVRAMKR